MASSGTIWGKQVGHRPRVSIYWKAVRQDIPNNRTEIEATLRLHSTYSLYFSSSKSGSLDGTAFTYTGGFSGTGQVNLSTKKFWVNHNSDGTKTQSISGSFSIAVKFSGVNLSPLTVSGNMSLERIPRGSALSSASITALKNGTSSTLTIGRTVHSSAFYHLVSVYDGNSWVWDTGYIKGAPSTTHTIPSNTVNTMLKSMSSVTSKSYTVRLRTYTKSGGSGLIGDVSRNMTASVHSDVKPSVNKPSVSISGKGRDKAIGKYVQSFSKVEASVSGSAGYGSSVRTYSMTVRRVGGSDSQSISGSKGTTSRPVALSGNYEVIGVITDTRGRSNTNRATFTVDAYSPPAITSFTAVRNGSTQTTVNITRATTHSPLGGGGNNNLSYTVQRRIGTGAWTNVNTRGSGTITANPSSDTSTSTGNSVTSSYEFRYVVTDQFGGRSENVASVSTQRVVLDIHKNEGVGIGKIREQGVLDVDGEAFFKGKISLEADTSGSVLNLKGNTPTGHGYVSYFGSNNVRRAYVGFGGVSSNWFHIANESGGPVNIVSSEVRVDGTSIVDSGSNKNGNWVQFYDGTQICFGDVVILASSGTGDHKTGTATFPKKFIDTQYRVVITPNAGGIANFGSYTTTTHTTSNFGIWVTRSSTSNIGVEFISIGRWK